MTWPMLFTLMGTICVVSIGSTTLIIANGGKRHATLNGKIETGLATIHGDLVGGLAALRADLGTRIDDARHELSGATANVRLEVSALRGELHVLAAQQDAPRLHATPGAPTGG